MLKPQFCFLSSTKPCCSNRLLHAPAAISYFGDAHGLTRSPKVLCLPKQPLDIVICSDSSACQPRQKTRNVPSHSQIHIHFSKRFTGKGEELKDDRLAEALIFSVIQLQHVAKDGDVDGFSEFTQPGRPFACVLREWNQYRLLSRVLTVVLPPTNLAIHAVARSPRVA